MKMNPHTWFYEYLKSCTQNVAEIPAIKSILVSDYTDGKTASLNTMYKTYPAAYRRMKKELFGDKKVYPRTLETARRRLLGLLSQFVDHSYQKFDSDLLKQLACRASGYDDFETIPYGRLRSLYRQFREKKAIYNDPWVMDILSAVKRDMLANQLDAVEKGLLACQDMEEWGRYVRRYNAMKLELARIDGEDIHTI